VYDGSFRVLSGHQYFVNGELRFPTDSKYVDGAYRSIFGYAVPHDGAIYCACNECVSLAVRRLTAKRLPLLPGMHEQLLKNQADAIADPEFQKFTEQIRTKYFSRLDELATVQMECIEHYADPHQKRELRIQAFSDLINQGWLGDPDHAWLKSTVW